jgi:sporulation protein YabP
MNEDLKHKPHEIVCKNRNLLEVSGVVGVESFDSEEFLLETQCGFLGIRGHELHIKSLNLENGLVAIEGQFYDMSYLDTHVPRADRTKNLLGKLFR